MNNTNTELPESILQNNLNETVSYAEFFHALGYSDSDTIFLRRFKDKCAKGPGGKLQVELWTFDGILPTLHTLNDQDNGIFYVVNGFGQQDSDVKEAKALFIDFDDFDFPEQLRRLNDFPLKPSIIIKTRKSLHPYWILKDGERDIHEWRELQNRLISYFGSDASIENPSRVMRLYGFEHRKKDPVNVTLIKFSPELTYSQRDFDAVLPDLSDQQKIDIMRRWKKPKHGNRPVNGVTVAPVRKTGKIVPCGERHRYVIKKAGDFVTRLGGSASPETVLAAVYADFLQNCENPENYDLEHFRTEYLSDIENWQSLTEEDTGFYKKAFKVWRFKNPDSQFPQNPSAADWLDVKTAYLEAEQDGTLDDILNSTDQDNAGWSRHTNMSSVGEEDVAVPYIPTVPTDVLKISFSKELELIRRKDGKVSASEFPNYVTILSEDEYLRGRIRHNALTGRPEIEGMFWDVQSHPIRDEDLYNLRLYVSSVYGIGNKDDIRQAIDIVAHKNSFHPVADYLRNLEWDGQTRLPDLFPRYLGVERSDYTTAVTTLLLHGVIQRVLNPGCKFDCCVILADTTQGTGKSSMCRFLALDDKWFCDSLGNLDDLKKAFDTIRGHIVCELGEMIATRKTKDIESIKAYLSRMVDNYKINYGIYSEDYPRQCVFIGTTNKPQFLPEDMSGNRRFIPLIGDGSKAERHPLDDENETREYVKQCYAEAFVIGERDGWTLTLDKRFDEELHELREQSTPDDGKVGMIQGYLDQCGFDTIVCSRMLWDALFNPNNGRPTSYELTDITDIMNTKISGWQRYAGKNGEAKDNKVRFPLYGIQRAWQRVPGSVPRGVPSRRKNVPSDEEKIDKDGFISAVNHDIPI